MYGKLVLGIRANLTKLGMMMMTTNPEPLIAVASLLSL